MRRAVLTVMTAIFFSVSGVATAPAGAGQGEPSNGLKWKAPSYKARTKNPVVAAVTSIAAGKEIYERQCIVCHGTGGKGDGPAGAALKPPPASLVDARIQAQSDGALFWKLSSGRAPMPGFEAILSEEDRWNVINYIRALTGNIPQSAD